MTCGAGRMLLRLTASRSGSLAMLAAIRQALSRGEQDGGPPAGLFRSRNSQASARSGR